MDANMMKFAMEQMRKMSPEQLQAMMNNMPPDAMSQAMAQMKDMKPEDWERAKQQMASMDPDTLARQAAQAQAQMADRTQYVLNASNQLKSEGNQLHGRGAFKEAVEKYERAKSNVESFSTKEAKDLVRACTLNLSSCYLNLKQYDKCVQQCNQVLSGEPDNLKALYRRGQAYLGSGDCVNAATDLERALRLTMQADPSQAQPIREKLQEAKDQVSALRAAGKLPPAEPKPAVVAAESTSGGTLASASVPAAAESSSASMSGSGKNASSSNSGRSGLDQEAVARASELLRSNPEILRQETARMMSDEQLRGIVPQSGMGIDPEVLRGGLGNMDPEVMAKVAQLQAELPPDLRGSDAVRNPESMKRLAEIMAQKPDLAVGMGKMLSSLDPERLKEMSRAAGLPPGVTITPEMAKAAAESFKEMSPKEVQEAIELVSKMKEQQPAATSSLAATAGRGVLESRKASPDGAGTSGRGATAVSAPPAAAAGMPALDPRMAAEMLAAMSPEQLAAMSQMVPGMDKAQLTPEMAKMAADMMKNMTAEDIARMQEMAAGLHGGAAASVAGAAVTSRPPAAAAAFGGFSPEMATAATEMMKNMGPEDLARVQEMAAKMGMHGGAATAGGMPGPAGLSAGTSPDAAMASMLSDPKMMESAVRMMKNMDPEALASMMMSAGMCKDRTQAEEMARQVSSLSDTKLQMIMRAASTVQTARAAAVRTMAWMQANIWLVLALIVLALGLLLKWLGYM